MTTNKDPAIEQEIPATEDGVVIRPALEVLSRLRKGRVMDLLSVELNRVVTGVKDSNAGKGGTVTLTLAISPVQKQQNAVFIQAKIVGKAPEDPPDSDLMFYDDDGNLTTHNPMQRDLYDDGPTGIQGGR